MDWFRTRAASESGCSTWPERKRRVPAGVKQKHRALAWKKIGVGDVLIGAAATIAHHNGVERASHLRDKLVEMTHLNEKIYGAGVAASHQGTRKAAGS